MTATAQSSAFIGISGDSAIAATHNSTHGYASAGTYVVVLTVTDDRGATGALSQPVTVTSPQAAAPTIALRVSPLLRDLCYPARYYGTRGCPSGGSVTISNTGGGTLKWTSTTSAPWLKDPQHQEPRRLPSAFGVDGTGLAPAPIPATS